MFCTPTRTVALLTALAGRFSGPDLAALTDEENQPRRWPAVGVVDG